ncbi:MAG TPA: Spy/CpxP family protein refolding chaperone [Burkholderiaceae bacterium]|nr:Spy/CpxP family protein refolding chaperone [Burkholderiaceae bacterium]
MAHTSTLAPRSVASRGARLAGAALLVAVLGTLTLSAWAQPGGHGGHRGMHGDGPGMMFSGRGLDRMLDSVNATTEQRAQVKQIAERTMADMKTQREAGRANREQLMKLFTAPVVDANAVEAARQQQMQQHDQASRRFTQAMVEVSRVLTPEQRKQLAERAAKRRDMMQRHMQERRSLEGSKQ